MNDRLRETGAMPESLRERVDALMANRLEEAHVDGAIDRLGLVRAVDAAHLGAKTKEALDGHVRVKRRTLRQVAHQALGLDRFFRHVVAADFHHARRGRNVAGDHSHGSGFAGTVRPEKAQNLPPFHGERDIVHGVLWPESLAQVLDFYHFYLFVWERLAKRLAGRAS